MSGDKAFLMEAVVAELDKYIENRVSTIKNGAGKLNDQELRCEAGRLQAANDIKATLTNKFKY